MTNQLPINYEALVVEVIEGIKAGDAKVEEYNKLIMHSEQMSSEEGVRRFCEAYMPLQHIVDIAKQNLETLLEHHRLDAMLRRFHEEWSYRELVTNDPPVISPQLNLIHDYLARFRQTTKPSRFTWLKNLSAYVWAGILVVATILGWLIINLDKLEAFIKLVKRSTSD